VVAQQPAVTPQQQPAAAQPPVVTKPEPQQQPVAKTDQQPPAKEPKAQQPSATVPVTQQQKPDVAKTDKPVTPAKPPVTQLPPPPVKRDSVTAPVVKAPVEAPKPMVLSNIAEIPHYVALVLDKVDPVYVNETRNAFTRYNREQFSAKGLSVNNQTISDAYKLVMIGTFPNATEAIAYIDKTRKLAATEIVPWLPAAKYSFVILTDNNLQVLMNTKDVNAFKKFLSDNYPGKF
jgi:hypothetical protein